MRLPLRPLPFLAGLVLLAACQDPAGVGLGLIDEEGADPTVRTLLATSVDTALVERTLIGFADSNATPAQTRVLAGDVADPVFGDARVTGYVDLIQPTIPGDTEAENVLAAQLEVQRTYVYGDTTASISLALRQVDVDAGPWSPDPTYPPDTLFAVGPVLTTSTVSVADEIVTFDLPESWVEANAATLVGDTFNEDFEGFALEPTRTGGVGAVFGFQAQTTQTRLRVFTTTDTLSYRLGEVFSSVQRTAPAALPPGVSPAQVSSGVVVAARFPLDTVGPLPVARAVFRAPLDLSFQQDGTFVRPIAERALLYGVEGDGTRTLIATVVVEGSVASTSLTNTLTPVLQDVVVGDRAFAQFELEPSGVPASLDILPVAFDLSVPGGALAGPTLSLTVVGT